MVEPRIVPRAEHSLSRRDVDPDALKVLYRLKDAGFIAYLVGGGVRDLLLGRRPKDFDIGTSAHPPQVKKLFRNCWIIGRRFRLALAFLLVPGAVEALATAFGDLPHQIVDRLAALRIKVGDHSHRNDFGLRVILSQPRDQFVEVFGKVVGEVLSPPHVVEAITDEHIVHTRQFCHITVIAVLEQALQVIP